MHTFAIYAFLYKFSQHLFSAMSQQQKLSQPQLASYDGSFPITNEEWGVKQRDPSTATDPPGHTSRKCVAGCTGLGVFGSQGWEVAVGEDLAQGREKEVTLNWGS